MKDLNKDKSENKLDSTAISKRRRNVAKAGLAAPIFMTLLNRPAWGAAKTMCSVSGFDSATVQTGGAVLSGTIDPDEVCSGVNAIDFWGKNLSTPKGIDGKRQTPNGFKVGTKFENIFGKAIAHPTKPGKKASFRHVIKGLTTATAQDISFASLYIDAFESQALGVPFVLGTPTNVVEIYKEDYSFFNNSWTSVEVDSFIAYLLAHPIP